MFSLNYKSINYVMTQILKFSCVSFSYVSISYVLAKQNVFVLDCDQNRMCLFLIVAIFAMCSFWNVFFLECSLFTVEFKRIVL